MDPIARPGRGGRYLLDAIGGVQPAGTPPSPAAPAAPATPAEAVPPPPSPRKTTPGKAGATKE